MPLVIGSVGDGDGAASALPGACAQLCAAIASTAKRLRTLCTTAPFATAPRTTRRWRCGVGMREARCEGRAMTANADIILLTYSIVLVGLTTGLQMLYVGGVRGRAMRLSGPPVPAERLRLAGAIFSVAGILAVSVMAVEILSGAAGTDIRTFIAATIIVPIIVVIFNALRDRVEMGRP